MAADTRVWMYRKGEARLFASPDVVPDGEGWSDRPDQPSPTLDPPATDEAPKPRRGRPPKVRDGNGS